MQYWTYKQAKRLYNIAPKYQCRANDDSKAILLWSTFGSFILIGPFIAWYKMFANVNQLIKRYNRGAGQDYYEVQNTKSKAPFLIIGGYYVAQVLIITGCILLLVNMFFGTTESDLGEGENSGKSYIEEMSYEEKEPLQTESEQDVVYHYEDATVESLMRNPELFQGKKIRVENNFADVAGTICLVTNAGYIPIEYDKSAFDEEGNSIGKILTGDDGYIEGTFLYEKDSAFNKYKIVGDKIVIKNYKQDETNSLVDVGAEEGNKQSGDGSVSNESGYSAEEIWTFYENIIIDATGWSEGRAQYALYDLDRDGISELILSAGTCRADWTETIYNVKDGAVSSMCSFYGPCTYYETENGNGVYAVYIHQGGNCEVRQLTKQNDEVSIQTVSQGGDAESYINNPEIILKTYEGVQQVGSGYSSNGGNNISVNYGGTDDADGYVFPDSSYVIFSGAIDVPVWMYQYGINEIYAKHGYVFSHQEVQDLFSWKNWYYTNYSFSDSDLSDIERQNINYFNNCIAASGEDAGLGLPSNAPSY